MTELNDTIQDLPLAGIIPVLLLIVAGLLLWAAGRRVLRVVFATAGLILGFGLGWMFAQSWDLGLAPWIPAAILGLALACTGALVYRVAVAGGLAVVCAIAGPAAVVATGEMQGIHSQTRETATMDDVDDEYGFGLDPDDEADLDLWGEAGLQPGVDPPDDVPVPFGKPRGTTDIRDDANDWLMRDEPGDEPDDESAGASPDDPGDPGDPDAQDPRSAALDHMTRAGYEQFGLDEAAASKVEEARGYAERVIDGAREWWAGTPEQLRPAMIGAAITGGLVGLLFGTLAPSLTAAIVSAFGGSMLWLGALRVLLARLGDTPDTILSPSATWTIVLWLITSLAGVAIQWTFRPKQADKAG